MTQSFYIAAYTASPSCGAWNPDQESQYFKSLANRSEIIGIEHPLFLNSDKYPIEWLVQNIPDHWSMIITTLPTFMSKVRDDPYFGLASVKESSRLGAVKLMEKINQYVCDLNKAFGRQFVKGVHFHSFPSLKEGEARGTKEALKHSMQALKKLDWQGAFLNLEHCDTFVSGRKPEKGFLTLDDEIEALKEVDGFGVVLNWARSAIEGRSIETPLQHIKMAQEANLLKGFFFSGCTDNPDNIYGPWRDKHMPACVEDALLNQDDIKQSLNLLSENVYLGVKVHDVSQQKNVDELVKLNLDFLSALTY